MEKLSNKNEVGDPRKTALLVAGAFAVAAALFFWRGRTAAAGVAGTCSLLLVVIGLFIPSLARIFHRAWMKFSFALGYVNSRIILTVIFFLVFVPYKLLSRLFGRDPLQLRRKNAASYWTPKEATRPKKEQFERLF
jgi:hypothetical protein